jgi:hypothetical protein
MNTNVFMLGSGAFSTSADGHEIVDELPIGSVLREY